MFDARSFLEGLYQPDSPDSEEADLGLDDLPADLRVEFEERAAIMEFDGRLPRERAEALALAEALRRMRKTEGRAAKTENSFYAT